MENETNVDISAFQGLSIAPSIMRLDEENNFNSVNTEDLKKILNRVKDSKVILIDDQDTPPRGENNAFVHLDEYSYYKEEECFEQI